MAISFVDHFDAKIGSVKDVSPSGDDMPLVVQDALIKVQAIKIGS